MVNLLFETYKNSVIPHGKHMFQTASDMAMTKICAYTSSSYSLPHWKCVLYCCAKYPWTYLTIPELDQHN